jgi:hypothetical protein
MIFAWCESYKMCYCGYVFIQFKYRCGKITFAGDGQYAPTMSASSRIISFYPRNIAVKNGVMPSSKLNVNVTLYVLVKQGQENH